MVELLDDSIIGEFEKILIYGRPKTGKTFASGTMPGVVFHLTIGQKNEIKTLRSPDFRAKHPRKDGQIYFSYVKETLGKRGIFTEANAYDWACDKVDEALEAEENGDIPHIDSIVVDSATGLRSVAMNKSIEIPWGKADKEKASISRLKEHGIVLPTDSDYFGEQSLIWKFINWLYGMDKHFLLITHEWTDYDVDRSTRKRKVNSIQPSFTGKQRTDVPAMFDNVWRFKVSGGEKGRIFEAQTIGDDVVTAGTRFGGVLGATERDVNFEEVINRLKNWQKDHRASRKFERAAAKAQ